MKNRVLTSVAIVVVLLALVIFSQYIFYPIAISLIAAMAMFEILRVMGANKNPALVIPAYLFALAFPVGAYFVEPGRPLGFILVLAACIFVYLIWLMGVSVFSKGKIPFSRIGEIFAAVTYVSVSFTSLSLIRYLDADFGMYTVFLVFLISWACDVFAFLVGSLFGKHKLIPEVSPKKTVEGAIGGIIFSAISCVAYGFVLDQFVEGMKVKYLILLLFGAILSVVSQLGDLVASLIKREYGVKDYGKIFPGHGGIMDRFDSVLAVSTIILILTIVFPPFRVL